MSRLTLCTLLVGLAALPFVGSAAAAPAKLIGSVGPGYTIGLKVGSKKATKLKAGVAYRLTVTDRSDEHDFRLVGPGVNRPVTGEEFVGRKSIVVRFRAGTYRFFCAPHADEMRGSFRAAR